MMEGFNLYIQQGLRTTLDLIRAIINDMGEWLDEVFMTHFDSDAGVQ